MTWRIGTDKGSKRESVVDARFGKYKNELPYDQDKSPAFNVN